jgi:hypothetical protein
MPLSKIVANSITDDTITTDQIADTSVHGRRNLVINGGMQCSQRATSSTSTGYCSLDRFRIHPNNTDELAYTWAQDSTVPAGEGFSKSAKVSITTAENSVADNEIFRILHRIEGQNMQQASWGTSGAKPLTLSFFVRSNVTGTYAVEFRMNAGGSNSLSKNYTINSADTWERKTITFPANTSTNFTNATSEGCELGWYLAAGANYTSGSLASDYGANATNTRAAGQTANVASSTSNTWYITGVQLEVGDKATPFEHRSFGEELTLCQRYFHNTAPTGTAQYLWAFPIAGASQVYRRLNFVFPTTMRANPSLVNGVGGSAGVSLASGKPTVESGWEGGTVVNLDLQSPSDTAYSWFQSGGFDAEL